MKLSDINPFIRYAILINQKSVRFFTCCYDCRLFYIKRGELTFFYGEEQHHISEGSLLIWQGGVPYRFDIDGDVELVILNFDFTQEFSQLTASQHVVRAEAFEPEKLLGHCEFEDCRELSGLLICRNMRHVEEELLTIVRETSEQKRFSGELTSAILKRLLCEAARETLSEGGPENLVERVISYIQKNYQNPITNRDIAEYVNYHEFYVNKLIRRQTGMTLHRYLLDCRLRNASQLLMTGALPIAKISELCGFTSAAYFVSVFRAQTGETPSEYRRRRSGLV